MTLKKRRIAVVAVILAATAVLSAYYLIDPADSDFMPRCTFKVLTGLDCPGCGSQRAFHALLHGRIADAFRFNPAIFFLIPLGALYAAVEWTDRWPRLRRFLLGLPAVACITAALVFWTIFRNLAL